MFFFYFIILIAVCWFLYKLYFRFIDTSGMRKKKEEIEAQTERIKLAKEVIEKEEEKIKHAIGLEKKIKNLKAKVS